MAACFKFYYFFPFLFESLGKDNTVSLFSKAFHTWTNTESEAYIGFLVSCDPESFHNTFNFLPNSIHRDNFYLQHTILQENLSSCSWGIFLVLAALSDWFRHLMTALSIKKQTIRATIKPWQNSSVILIPKAFEATLSIERRILLYVRGAGFFFYELTQLC